MEIRLFSLDLIGLLFLVMLWRGSALLRSRTVRGVIRAPLSSSSSQVVEEHTQFLQNIAKIEVPRRLPVLLEALKLSGKEIVSPNNRKGLNPFLIPLARDPKDNSMTCYLRWPTQREDMDLQIVQTQEAGVKLVSPSTDKLCHRLLVESDFYGEKTAPHLAELVNKDGTLYNLGDYLSFLKSGKFPSSTPAELRLVLDRFVLSKVGPFVDCYERLAENFYNQGNSVSSLVTCERSATVFYSWGHPNAFHAQMLVKMDRIREAKDTARSCMANPKWTLASTFEVSSLLYLTLSMRQSAQ